MVNREVVDAEKQFFGSTKEQGFFTCRFFSRRASHVMQPRQIEPTIGHNTIEMGSGNAEAYSARMTN
jgi:hypothetical protein